MKKELALRIVHLNEVIQEQEFQLTTQKDMVKDLKERREALLRELVMLVTDSEDE